MAIARVQISAAAVTTTGTGTITPTLPGAITAGNLVVICIGMKVGATSPTIGTPAGWTQADQPGLQTNGCTAGIFYKENTAGGDTLPLFTASSATPDMYAVAIEYSGIATSSSLDVHTTGSSVTAVTALTTGTTGADARAAELLVGINANSNVNNTSSDAMGGSATGGSIAKLLEATSANGTATIRVTGRCYEYIATGTGTAEFNGTLGTARAYGGVVATFVPPAAAGTDQFFPAVVGA